MKENAFFIPDGRTFISTELTRGPWSAKHQHGGPSAALLARAIEEAAEGFQVTRITVEFLRPIPIEPMTITTEVLQRGRSVLWIDATLKGSAADLARARAVCIRR
jgi:acyl-coenzyme A thioesterase PaaI-like protein